MLSDVLDDLVVTGYRFCGHLITLLLHQSQLCLGLGLSSQGRLLLLLLAPTHLLHLDQRNVEVLLRRGRHANLGHRCRRVQHEVLRIGVILVLLAINSEGWMRDLLCGAHAAVPRACSFHADGFRELGRGLSWL